ARGAALAPPRGRARERAHGGRARGARAAHGGRARAFPAPRRAARAVLGRRQPGRAARARRRGEPPGHPRGGARQRALAGAPGGALRALRGPLALALELIAAAAEDAAALAREELVEVLVRDRVQLQAELAGQLRGVP